MAFAILDIKPIGGRRLKLCQKFAKKTLKSRQHANLFRINHNLEILFGDTTKSPVNYLTGILNNEEESWNISDYVL